MNPDWFRAAGTSLLEIVLGVVFVRVALQPALGWYDVVHALAFVIGQGIGNRFDAGADAGVYEQQ